jgi:hypothetical protein
MSLSMELFYALEKIGGSTIVIFTFKYDLNVFIAG